jgi:thiamine biosynthesis lipoprotein
MNKSNWIRLAALIFIIALAAVTYHNRQQEFQQMEIALDTLIEIQATAPSKVNLKKIVNQAFKMIKNDEKKFSFYDEESVLYNINQSSDSTFYMDNEINEIFSLAGDVYIQTDSLYDLTIGALSELWDFENEIVPSEQEIMLAKSRIGWQNLRFNQESFERPAGFKINTGSIVKGFIIDKIIEFLKTSGVHSGIVNAGGDIRIFGQTKPLKIGVKHPRRNDNEVIKVLHLQNVAVVTTGDYERFFIQNGKRYHHIINPKTGYPSNTMISISVIHPSAFFADAYATGLFLLTPQAAVEVADSIADLSILIYYEENGELKSMKSNGLEKYEK